MIFVVVHSSGLWVFTNFLESLDLAREVNKPNDPACIVENNQIADAIMRVY